MNQLTIIGNLTRDPETRQVAGDKSVCTMNVAVNRRFKSDNQPDADFFRVSVWGKLGENCQKYLEKGRKVGIIGQVSSHAYAGKDGTPKASLEVFASEVEFLTGRNETVEKKATVAVQDNEYVEVDESELPF